MDRLYRVTFSAKPIVLHASSAEQAKQKALQYAAQPEAKRIVVEETIDKSRMVLEETT